MRSRKLYSVGVVSMLVVLASVAGVAFTTGSGTNADVSSTSNADIGSVPAQQNGTNATTDQSKPTDRANAVPLHFENTSVEGVFDARLGNDDRTAKLDSNDNDSWYSFEVKKGQAIRAWTFGFFGQGGEPKVTLVGPDGRALSDLGIGGDNIARGVVAERTGTYYIHVHYEAGSPVPGDGSAVQVANPDRFEPNDNPSTATPLVPGKQVTALVTNGSGPDWFAVNASEGATINATLQHQYAFVKSPAPEIVTSHSVDVFDSNGSRISKAVDKGYGERNETRGFSGPDAVTVVAKPEKAGTYYVRVPGGSFGFSPYSLTVSGEGLSEPGNGANATTETPTTTATQTTTETPTTTTSETTTITETPQSTTTATENTDRTETTTAIATQTETATTEQNQTTYYQVDLVSGEPIENLRGEEGTYTNGELIRFAHGSSDDPITRRSEGEFTTNDTLADRIESQNITVENGTATTTFTVAEGDSVTLSLVSYTKPGPGWSPQTEHQQEFVDSDTKTFDSGTHMLSVELPTENGRGSTSTTTATPTETTSTTTTSSSTTTETTTGTSPSPTTETETSSPSATSTSSSTTTATESITSTTSAESVDDGPGDDLNCDDFPSKQAAQRNLDNNPSDPNNLDADDDDEACDAGVDS